MEYPEVQEYTEEELTVFREALKGHVAAMDAGMGDIGGYMTMREMDVDKLGLKRLVGAGMASPAPELFNLDIYPHHKGEHYLTRKGESAMWALLHRGTLK